MKFQTIITASALVKNLDNPNWLILDCRAGIFNHKLSYDKYSKSHIPNSFYCCFDQEAYSEFDKNSTCSSISAANPCRILSNLNENGFDATSQIIIYDDDSDSSFANTVWLVFRSLGCQSVAVLQGGYSSWMEENDLPQTRQSKTINAIQYESDDNLVLH